MKKPRLLNSGAWLFSWLGRLEACPTQFLSRSERTTLGEQFLDHLAAVGDLHGAAVLAGEGGFQRDAEGLADGGHHVLRGVGVGLDRGAVLVGLANRQATLHSRAAEDH